MGDGRVSLTPCANFYRPVEELECTDLLKTPSPSPIKTGVSTLVGLGELTRIVICSKTYWWGKGEVDGHMDPTIGKATTGKERLVPTCAESQ